MKGRGKSWQSFRSAERYGKCTCITKEIERDSLHVFEIHLLNAVHLPFVKSDTARNDFTAVAREKETEDTRRTISLNRRNQIRIQRTWDESPNGNGLSLIRFFSINRTTRATFRQDRFIQSKSLPLSLSLFLFRSVLNVWIFPYSRRKASRRFAETWRRYVYEERCRDYRKI